MFMSLLRGEFVKEDVGIYPVNMQLSQWPPIPCPVNLVGAQKMVYRILKFLSVESHLWLLLSNWLWRKMKVKSSAVEIIADISDATSEICTRCCRALIYKGN